MERDYMGFRTVKQEIPEEPTDPARSLAKQWSFSNKAHPQYHHTFTGSQDQSKPKTGFNSLASAGLVTITTTEAVDSIHQPYSAVAQKNTMLNYPPHQFGAHSVQKSHDVRVLPVANQTHQVSVSTSMPGHQPFVFPAGQNVISTVNPQPVRGASMTSPISIVPTRNGVVGTTELRGAPKTSEGPAQLTIFYGGSVCVYENVSPEKAQAIMLLAGNAPPVTPSTTSTASPVQTIPKSPSLDAFVSNQCHSTMPSISSRISRTSQNPVQTIPKSPSFDAFVLNQCHSTMPSISNRISITSQNTSQTSVGVSNNSNEVTIIKSIGVLNSPSNTAEPSKVIGSQESRPPSHILSAVPQARKASLARFLEKRKERVLTTSPYANNKETPQCSNPVSGNWSFFANSSGSSVLPASNLC